VRSIVDPGRRRCLWFWTERLDRKAREYSSPPRDRSRRRHGDRRADGSL